VTSTKKGAKLQDTHVDRAGRTLIRDVMDEAGCSFTVRLPSPLRTELMRSSWKSKHNTLSFEMNHRKGDGMRH
jgi:hypothetical protein